jgi:hypothetical protein
MIIFMLVIFSYGAGFMSYESLVGKKTCEVKLEQYKMKQVNTDKHYKGEKY